MSDWCDTCEKRSEYRVKAEGRWAYFCSRCWFIDKTPERRSSRDLQEPQVAAALSTEDAKRPTPESNSGAAVQEGENE